MSRATLHGEFPPAPLREYALIADGERGALCGPHGEIVWLCAPRWHHDAVFASLVGGSGAYAVTPAVRSVWGGTYETGTLIWQNRWATDENSVVVCRDALAMPSRVESLVLLRRIEAENGEVQVHVHLDPRARFGHERMRELRRDDAGVWTARVGELYLRWTGAGAAHETEHGLELGITVAEGDRHDLVLEIGERPFAAAPPVPDEQWSRTVETWRAEVPAFESSAAPRDTRHAYAVMRGLTSQTGGMVAAATTSLPERADADRNYDYRYVWIRDQCFAGVAVAADGDHPLLRNAMSFVTQRLLADGDGLAPAYLVDGGPIPDEEPLDISGYPGGIGVRGNRVTQQFQLDAFGEALNLLSAAAGRDCLDADGRRAAEIAVGSIEKNWKKKKDSGIWELKEAWWTHSRLSCVAGLRNWAPHSACGSGLLELADQILEETTKRCLHPTGYWQRTQKDERVDAALLLPPVRGALAEGDPRTTATLAAVRRTLLDDWYVYRYHPESGQLGDEEGAFLLCGFLLALAELAQGNVPDAYRAFERNRAACGPPGLLAEEFDVAERQLRGNLPQAFVHAQLLEVSVRLGAR
jgi:hypothetical protein